MMGTKEIIHNGEVVARLITEQDWKEGLGFFSHDHEYIQVGTWNYAQNKVVERVIDRTQEVVVVMKGSLKAGIYTLEEEWLEDIIVQQGEVLILLNCGHGYEILEDDTRVFEIKNGPYLGADVDRRRF
jgi:hypothetical protein